MSASARGFRDTLPTLAAGPLRAADPSLLADLLDASADALPYLTPAEQRQIEACAHRRHHLDAALPALRALLPTALGLPAIRDSLPIAQRALLVARFLQMREPGELANPFELDGRAAVDRESRKALGELLAGLADAGDLGRTGAVGS